MCLSKSNVEVTGAARLYRAASVWTAGLGIVSFEANNFDPLIHSLDLQLKPAPGRKDQHIGAVFVTVGVCIAALLPNLAIGEFEDGFAVPPRKFTVDL